MVGQRTETTRQQKSETDEELASIKHQRMRLAMQV